jgi:peptidoglycan/xylan/chitin deacetylase (PgdA/CDA1 family)
LGETPFVSLRRIAICFCAFAVFVLALVLSLRPREPRYEGKRLGEWVEQYALATQTSDAREQDEAAEALRRIGPAALRVFLEDLQAKDPAWKKELAAWASDKVSLKLDATLAGHRVEMAGWGFSALGRAAEPALPKLSALVFSGDLEVAQNAMSAVLAIGGEQAVAICIGALTNANADLRNNAAVILAAMRSDARPAIPALLGALEQGDGSLRRLAARALGEIACDPETVVPALDRALRDMDSRVRSSAAFALSSFGEQATASLPAMRAHYEALPENRRRFMEAALLRVRFEMRQGPITRGPKDEKKLALVFTGHEFGEGGETILNELQRHHAKASFFLTGVFLEKPEFEAMVERIVRDKHYLGPHSDKHLLYCAWDQPNKTLITQREFRRDLDANAKKLSRFNPDRSGFGQYFLPPFEHYNREIADWTRRANWTLINFTPGTRSTADYTGEADKNFLSSQVILNSIVKKEQEDPRGLNGFILLLHVGAGPGRADKFHARFGELLDYLSAKGYQFVRVDEMLQPPMAAAEANAGPARVGGRN